MTAPSAGALRQARYRRHRKGDHSLCLPENCASAGDTPEDATGAETANGGPATAALGDAGEFGPSGQAIWMGTLLLGKLTAAQRALLREVCRMADRVDELHQMIDDNADDMGLVKWMLREARQQAIAMKGLIGELRLSGVAGGNALNPADDPDHDQPKQAGHSGGGGPGVADIRSRIAAKLAQAQG